MRCAVTGDGAGLAARSRRSVETLLVPWVMWQVFYLCYNYSAVYPVQFWAPIGITWYLTSLFMWRASVQYVGPLRHLLPLTFAAGEVATLLASCVRSCGGNVLLTPTNPSLSSYLLFPCALLIHASLPAGLLAGFTDTPSTLNGLAFLDFQRMVAFLPIFYLGMLALTPQRLAG